MEIAAIRAAAQCLCAGKAYFSQPAVGHVVGVAKQAAQLGATVFSAGRMPKALFDRNVKAIFPAALLAFPQIGDAHYFKENAAVNSVKPRYRLHFCRGCMLFGRGLFQHVFLNIPMATVQKDTF